MVNLADKNQVKNAALKEDDLRRQEMNDIRTVLSNVSGRRLMWRLLSRCKTFESVMSEEHSSMSYNSGQQDFGHFIMAEISEADENLLMRLMKDNYKKES